MISRFNTLSKQDSKDLIDEWTIAMEILPTINEDYILIRDELTKTYHSVTQSYKDSDYLSDIYFGASLYDYLEEKDWFNIRLASNDGFWRYLSCAVLPHIVNDRWPDNIDDHAWKKSNRIWLKVLWWYIYLSYNETTDKTISILSSNVFNTDNILNLVERTGRKGVYIDVYRKIMYFYSQVDPIELIRYKKSMQSSSDSLFRSIMRLNTVRLMVCDPYLVTGGINGYVLNLFKAFNITF